MTKRNKLKVFMYITSSIIIILSILIIIFNSIIKSKKIGINGFFSYEEFKQYRDMIKFSNQINIIFLLSVLFGITLIWLLSFFISRTCNKCGNGKLILQAKDFTQERSEEYKKEIPIRKIINTMVGRTITISSSEIATKRIKDFRAVYVCNKCGETTIKETSKGDNL